MEPVPLWNEGSGGINSKGNDMERMFFTTMTERQTCPIGSPEWEACDRACLKYLWWMLGIPTNQWSQQ